MQRRVLLRPRDWCTPLWNPVTSRCRTLMQGTSCPGRFEEMGTPSYLHRAEAQLVEGLDCMLPPGHHCHLLGEAELQRPPLPAEH